MGSDTLTKFARPRKVIKAAEVKLIWEYRVTPASCLRNTETGGQNLRVPKSIPYYSKHKQFHGI